MVFADNVARDDVSGSGISGKTSGLSVSDRSKAAQGKHDKLAMATRESGLRDAAMRFTDWESLPSTPSQGRVTEIEQDSESDVSAMLIVALCVALLSIIRRMSSV